MGIHGERELQVFRDFVADASLDVDAPSIEKVDPPLPDLRCRNLDGQILHFEVSEILDPGYAALLRRFHDGRVAAKSFYENLSAEQREVFDERFADSSIFLNYTNEATTRHRMQCLPAVFDFLLSLPPNRPKSFELDESLPSPYLERIAIYRDHQRSKPLFESAFGTSTNASAITVVQKKIAKTYVADGPISLLAFWYDQPMLPEGIWLEDVERYIQEVLDESIFAECWLYDWANRKVMLRKTKER